MKNYCLTAVAMLSFYCSSGQENWQNISENHAIWSIKLSPLGLIEPDQAISVASEMRISSHIGIQLEGSYIFNTLFLATNIRTVSNTYGIRLVPEIRYYDIDFKQNLQRYLGIQLSYKNLRKNVTEWIGKPNYEQLESVPLKKYNMAFAFIAGLQNHAHLIGFDFNIGMGIKYKSILQNSSFSHRDFIPSYLGETLTGFYPHLSATFKLCLKIK